MTVARTRQAIGRQNRARGQAFERLVAKELAKVWPEARRNLSQVRTAKREGGDILGVPYHVECKSGKANLSTAWDQASSDNLVGLPTVVVYRSGRRLMVHLLAQVNERICMASVRLDDWLATNVP